VIVDFDDFHEANHKYDRLHELKALNPLFKVTLFAVPGRGSPGFWEAVPAWCELVVHGWEHPDPFECAHWSKDRMLRLMDTTVCQRYFLEGFKAPGWQISDGCYEALAERGWWVADQHLEDGRRPESIPTYFYEDGADRWHGHVQDIGTNGIEETWPELSRRVAEATEFRFASEALV
jgi:hypothetical protein